MKCARVQADLDAWLRSELDASRQAAIERHLAHCADCSQQKQQLEEMAELLLLAGPEPLQVPAGVAAEVLRKVRPRRRPARRRSRRQPAAQGRWLWLAAAALLVLLPLGFWLRNRVQRAPGAEPETEAAVPGEPSVPEVPLAELTPQPEPLPDHAPEPLPEPPPVPLPDPPPGPVAEPPTTDPESERPPEPVVHPDPDPEPAPTSVAELPQPERTGTPVAVVLAGLEDLSVDSAAAPDTLWAGATLRVESKRQGARLQLLAGGEILLGPQSEALLSGDSLELRAGEALLDLRDSTQGLTLLLGPPALVVTPGCRAWAEIERQGAFLAVLDGQAQLPDAAPLAAGFRAVASESDWQIRTKTSSEPAWARKLRPRYQPLFGLELDRQPFPWSDGSRGQVGEQPVLHLGPVDNQYYGLSAGQASGQAMFRNYGRIQLYLEIEVSASMRAVVQVFDGTRQDNYQWSLQLQPGQRRSFHTQLDAMSAADGSNIPFGTGHAVNGVRIYAAEPGSNAEAVVYDFRIFRERE